MASKVLAGIVVAFWLTMMVALVRFEFYPTAASLGAVSIDRVLQKVFANREPARMNVYYGKNPVGFCRVDILPLATPTASAAETFNGTPKAFQVHTDLTMELAFFGTPSRFHLDGDSRFTPRYDIISFRVKTSIGEGRVDVQGDEQSKKVNVRVDIGEKRETRQFDFDALRGSGFGSLIGAPGFANLGFPPQAGFGAASESSAPTIHVIEDRFNYNGVVQRAFLVDIRSGDTMWGKVWVSDSGEVLFVDTSMGVTMVSDLIDNSESSARAKIALRRTRGKGHRRHDPD